MNLTDKISKYLTLLECVKSETASRLGIINMPGANEIRAMIFVATNVFDKVREFVGGPLFASSFFRCPELNGSIGGSKTSQHMKGEAIDIDADRFGGKTNKEIFDFIRKNLPFDQMIWEFGSDQNPDWVHVSLCETPSKNRREILRAYRDPNKGATKYIPFDLYKV